MEIILKSKIVRQTLKAKGYDLNQVEKGRADIDEDLRRLLEKLADEKPVVKEKGEEEPEVTILRRIEADGSEDSSEERKPDGREVVQSLVERIPEDERQKLNETLSRSVPMPEAEVGATKSGNCNTLKMVTGKPFGITKIGARIMSIITVGGHEVLRNLIEPSDQTTMHIDVYADYISAISPQTT